MIRAVAPKHFYQAGGTLSADALSYVPRQADHELLEHVSEGDFCYVLTPRQLGKSSLMVRTIAQLKKKRIASVEINLQGKTEIGMSTEAFYAGLLDAFIRNLQLPVKLAAWWREHALLSAVQRFSNFVADEVLPHVRKRLVVFVDEIERTRNLDFSDDFFAALRAFYNERARNPAFKRLTFVLLGAVSPQNLVRDRTQSPFNIGSRVELTDFTFEEARTLTRGFPLEQQAAERVLQRVLYWTDGHPYLTQQVCTSLTATKSCREDTQSVDTLVASLFLSDAMWSDLNLTEVRDRIVEDKDYGDDLLALYRRIYVGEQIFDDERSPVHAALKLSGIVKVVAGGILRPRNKIYEHVFGRSWVDTMLRIRKNTHVQPSGNGSVVAVPFVVAGSGAAVTAGDVAAGAGSVAVCGDVHGRVNVGSPAPDASEAVAIYCRMLVNECRHLSLRGLDIGASDATGTQPHFDLTQVYVDLLTTTQALARKTRKRQRVRIELDEERQTRPLSALEAISAHHRVVLLGDPGSGKSTFLTHLALCLAMHGLEPKKKWLDRLPGWPAQNADVLPVLVTLRDFAQSLPERPTKAEASSLWQFITEQLRRQNLDFVAEPLRDKLEHGQVLLLLDGLDEIPRQQHRTFVRDAVTAFARRYAQCRIVVTCRTLSYQDAAWKLADFQSETLASFNGKQIDGFITAWYAELARLGSIKAGTMAGVTRHFQAAVRRPDLWRLASNPLLLTAMALVHTHKGQLPEARALLYEETIDILLWRWEQVKVSGTDDAHRLRQLLTQAERTDVELKRALWQLAFLAHQKGGTVEGEGVADIGEAQLEKALRELHPDRSKDWADQVIEVMKVRAGLLLERAPAVYTFPHRTFQEYLAGAHLALQPDFAQQAARLAAEGALWREVILLAVGRLVYRDGDTAKPLALIAELCPAKPGKTANAWWQVWLAGDVLLEMGRNRAAGSALGRELVERVGQRLVELLQGSHLSSVERARAGDTLARLGDPRFRADAWFLPNESLLGFVDIPAGPSVMGSNKKQDPQAAEEETPQHTLPLPGYYISRYPVTVAQFRAFIKESGHDPQDRDCLRALDTYPVVNITWHEALKYCQWLTTQLRAWQKTPEPLATLLRKEGWEVTLPSEAEWEKAARGTEGLLYPWGNDWREEHANTAEARIGHPSAVGCFPQGVSPYGCLDMAGNVWEWTRSLWGEDGRKPDFLYPYNLIDGREDLHTSDNVLRVLRGGGYWGTQRGARGAFRDRHFPVSRGDNVGCRIVVRPCVPSEL